MANTKPTKPEPPASLSDEALLEWHRITDELAAAGSLDATDRALLTLYCRTWQTWAVAAAVVAIDGPVVLLPNNWPGQSSEYKTMEKLGGQLSKLLDQLGLTPAARAKQKTVEALEPLDF